MLPHPRTQIPEYVVFKEQFPMTVTGKYMKHKMREQTIAELHLEKEVVATA
jgi:fatty-acyl-CoA synthase